MSNEANENRPPRRGHGPMGHGRGPAEKPNDFKAAMKRLFSELKSFKILIVIALILALAGAVLSIMAPDKLKDLTNEIQKGIVPNTENLQTVMENLSDIQTGNISAYEIDGVTITVEDQMEVAKKLSETLGNENMEAFMTKIQDGDTDVRNSFYKMIDELPESVQSVVKPKMDMTAVKKIALILATMYVLSALFTFIESIAMTDVANKFAKKLRSRISVKINKLPLKYFDKHQSGDVLSRVTNDVDTIAQSMNQSLATLVSSITLFVGTIFMMFKTNFIMALTAIFSSLIGFVFVSLVLKKSQKYFTARQVELGKLNGHIEEVYSGLNVVKVYNGKKEADKKFDEYNKSVYECNRKSQFLSGLMQPMMNFIGNFGYVAVCIVGALLTMNGKISFGVIVAFITYVRLFTSPLSQIAQALTSLQSTAAASERVFEFVDEKEMADESSLIKTLDKSKVKGNIEFEHVVFQYDGNDKPTINDFSASAKPRSKDCNCWSYRSPEKLQW
jgi:ATP-binding cassette subfamily B protein